MKKLKSYIKLKNVLKIFKFCIIILIFNIWLLNFLSVPVFAQNSDIDFNLDISSKTRVTPDLLRRPGIDLSGRGFHGDPTWPQNLAAPEALARIDKELDLRGGVFRLQFDLWEFVLLAKNKQMQTRLFNNYSSVIKNINAAGGVIILDLYGMPPGLGKVLDKKSSPWDIKAFKELVKDIIRYFSCEKGYNIWYEVWNAPDLDGFFIGQKKEYYNIYQAVAESVKELERETNQNIPIGGPGVSWWFQNLEGNTILHPEKSLIYELIRFCSQRGLPLDFISWHAYTSDPFAESEVTGYKKIVPELIREWLSYFGLDATIPLVISEWNYDSGLNFEPKRGWESYIAASFIPSRIRNMLKSGIDYQILFCLEDFKNNKEGVNQNVGLFWFEPEYAKYTGGPKSMFNVIRMLNMLGGEMFLSSRLDNEFIGIIATKKKDGIALLLFNYIDKRSAKNYLSRHIAELPPKLAKSLVTLMDSSRWDKILSKELPLKTLRLHRRIKAKIQEAIDYKDAAALKVNQRLNINLSLTKLEGDYIYKKYVVDKTCRLDCAFLPQEEKEIKTVTAYKETLILEPYSVVLILMDKKQKEGSAQPLKAEAVIEKENEKNE
ncbi:MAG: cellulase family glycosylhydrolase [Candidatus Omnitrophota bacterium]